MSAGLERAFNEEIRRYGGQVRDKLRRRNLAAFRSELEVALQACPKPVGWRQGADCVSAEAGGAEPGADGQPEPPPAAAIQVAAKLDQGGTKPRLATQPTPGLAMREAGLDLGKRDLECIENIRSCGNKQLDELYTSIVTANACRGGPLTLAWDRKHRYSIACPAVQSDQLINLYGLVRLAGLLREMHRTLIQPAAVAAADRPLLPMLPEGSTSEEVRERGRQLYETCLLAYQDGAHRSRDGSAGSDDGRHGEDADDAAQRVPGGNESKPTSPACTLSAGDDALAQPLGELGRPCRRSCTRRSCRPLNAWPSAWSALVPGQRWWASGICAGPAACIVTRGRRASVGSCCRAISSPRGCSGACGRRTRRRRTAYPRCCRCRAGGPACG